MLPATTAKDLDAAIVPPPVKPFPAVKVTPEWSMFSFATYPDKLCMSIFDSCTLKKPVELTVTRSPTFIKPDIVELADGKV